MLIRLATKVSICISFIFFIKLHTSTASFNTYNTLYTKGEEYLLYCKFDSALYCFEKIRIESQQKRDDSLHVAALNKLSETYAAYYKPAEAEQLAQQALKLAEEKFGKNSIQYLIALNHFGNANYLRGRHQIALEAFNTVMQAYDKLPENQKIMLASPVIMGLGNVYFSKYQYNEALRYFQQALALNAKYFGMNHPYVASSLISLGNLYRNMGSYSNAQQYYDEASTTLIAFFGDNHPSVAATYIGKADLCTSQRQFDLASSYLDIALSIYKQFLNPGDPRFGDVYLGLGDIAKGLGNYAEAVEWYKKALQIFENSVGLEHQNTVKANLEIGNSYMYDEESLKALEYYNKVLEINYMLVGELHTNTSGAYNNLGSVYYFIGNFKLALDYYERALKIDKTIYGNDHPSVANCYYNIAKVYSEKGESAKALDYIQLAINSSIIDFENEDIYVTPALLNYFDDKDLMWYLNFKGEVLEAGFKVSANMKGLDVALKSFIKSDSLIDKIRESYTNKKDQADLEKLTRKIYASAVNSAFSLVNLLTPQNVKTIDRDASYNEKLNEYKEILYYFSEKSKANLLFSSVAKVNAKKFGGVPDSLLEKEIRLKTTINRYTQELNLQTDPQERKNVSKLLNKANQEYEDLLATLKHRYPKYHNLKYDFNVVKINKLQKYLSDSTTLISYLVTKDALFIIVISQNKIDIYKQKYNEQIEKSIRAFKNSITFKLDGIYASQAYQLYKYLLPFNIPKNTRHLLIVPDGPIHFIPFEALLNAKVDLNKLDYTNLPYLIKDYSISYTYSANLWYKQYNDANTIKDKPSKELFALAPVDFNYYLENKKLVFPSLPGTYEEVENITKEFQLKKRHTEKLLKEEANEQNVKKLKLADFQYLHFATHGIANPENPEKSGILLHGGTQSSEDDILYSSEIYNLDLNAELTILSACETGLGKLAQGEGVIGLGRSLLYASTKNFLISLWSVSDAATNQLMSTLYKDLAEVNVPLSKLKFIPYAEYIRKSKMELIRSGNFSEPYYWAPFILQGR